MSERFLLFCFFILVGKVITPQVPGDKVRSVYVDEYGQQWFGTDKGLLRRCGDGWKTYNTGTNSPGIVNVIEHQEGINGVIWIGTNSGIIRINYSSKSILNSVHYNSVQTEFKSDKIKAIAFDNKLTGYFATPAGIGVFSNTVWKFYTKLFEVFRNEFTSARVKGDTIYFRTIGEGVARITRYLDGYTGASAYVKPWSAIPSDTITCIFFDSKGHQWYGTNQGISRHVSNEAKEGWNFRLADELPDKHVTAIEEDFSGNIWIGTMRGLVKLNKDLKIINTWYVRNGLPSDIINDIFIENDKSVWIGTDLGVSHFNGHEFINIRTSRYARAFIDL
jgi:ligand-binding sensor domain-containing protein